MRRKLIVALALIGSCLNAGCLLNQYSSEPNIRMSQLLNQSEDLRQIEYEKRRIWMNDQPSHLTPERVHGGIMP